MTKVLVVATSRKTRGGITSVIKAHETGEQWKEFHCKWIETHIDKCIFLKLIIFYQRSYIIYTIFTFLQYCSYSYKRTTICHKKMFFYVVS